MGPDLPLLIQDPHEGLLPISSEVFRWQFDTLNAIARAYHYKPVFIRVLGQMEAGPRKNFIMQMHGVSFLSFIIEWCKIFGANNNEIHWKKLYAQGTPLDDKRQLSPQAFEQRVRRALLRYAGITHEEFKQTYESVKNARDRFAAHVNPNDIPEMPFFDKPYRIANALTVLFTGIVGDEFRILDSYQAAFTAEITSVLEPNVR